MQGEHFRTGVVIRRRKLISGGCRGKRTANRGKYRPHRFCAFSTAYDLRTKSAKSTGSERNGPRRAIFGLFRAWPVNRFTPKNPGILPKSGGIGRGESECRVGRWRRKGDRKGERLWSLLFNTFNILIECEPFQSNADFVIDGLVLARGEYRRPAFRLAPRWLMQRTSGMSSFFVGVHRVENPLSLNSPVWSHRCGRGTITTPLWDAASWLHRHEGKARNETQTAR